jgi:hypothetical protein
MANANALPAYGGPTVPLTYNEAWTQLRQSLASIQAVTTQVLGLIAAGPVSAQNIVNMSNGFANQITTLNSIGALGTPLATYAMTQAAYLNTLGASNITAGFNAIVSALTAVTTWVNQNAPGNALTINSSGQVIWATISQASLSPLTTLLNTLAATIT